MLILGIDARHKTFDNKQMTQIGIAFTGSGSATPTTVLNNESLSQIVDTSDEWIVARTGIQQRRLASLGDSVEAIATAAARQALDMAGIAPTDLDMIVLATSTADDLFGSANRIQAALGAHKAVAFDLTAACSGFVFGLVTAAQFIRTGVYQNVLLIGADLLSRWVDWQDRGTCILFGDGAGALVLQAVSGSDRLLGFELRSDGTQNQSLQLAFQPQSRTLLDHFSVAQGQYQFITMNGKEIYRFAVQKVPEVIEKALYRANLTAQDVDWLILHQANQRILDAVAERLQIPSDRVVSNLAKYGNTSAASIPLALDEAVRDRRIKTGDTIATAGFGAGLTWGSAVFQWGK